MVNTKTDSTESIQPSALDKLREIKNIDEGYKGDLRVLVARIDEVSQSYGLMENALAWVEEIKERYEGIDKKDKDRQKETFESVQKDILIDIVELKKTKRNAKSEEELLEMIKKEAEEMQRVIEGPGKTESRRHRGRIGPKGGKQSGIRRVF